MKIGIDYVATVGGGGNSVYSKNLIDSIIALDNKDEYYFYVYVHDYLKGRFRTARQHNLHWRPAYVSSLGLPIPDVFIRLLNSILYKFWANIDRVDVCHFTNPLNFITGAKKNVITIHDLGSFHNKEWSKESSRKLFHKVMRKILRSSSSLISVSEYTKQDLIKTFNVDPGDITVIYEAANTEKYYLDADTQYLKKKFDLNSFILYVGQLQPRKNIVNMLIAYAKLPSELKEKFPFILVGAFRDEEYSRLVHETISRYQLSPYIIMLGRLDGDALRKLYSGAKVFVFASVFEGFGLPVLESLQCGTPVITSNSSSLPEVVGDAGVLVDPNNASEIASTLEKMLTDEHFYKDLKSRCLTQAKKFSWKKAAQQTIKFYGETIS